MSQITRCPACQTVFRVVQDQLRMSDGWVRCGQCTEVFDARASLASSAAELSSIELAMQALALTQPHPEPYAPPPALLATAKRPPPEAEAFSSDKFEYAAPSGPDAPDAAPPAPDGADARPERGSIEPVLLPESLAPDEPSVADDYPEAPEQLGASPVALAADTEPDSASPQPSPDATLGGLFPAVAQSEAPPATADVSFMRAPARASPPPSGARRFLTSTLALVLFAVLAAQVAVLERDRLAAMFPQFKPALVWMCEHLDCSVAALRHIESVVIDSSSFNRAKGDSYRLSLVLRNTSSIDIAIPSVELTLTDSQDQALFRRVLSAQELGKPANPAGGLTEGVLAAGAEWQGQATITVRLAANAERFTGYRVLAFYP